MLLQTPAAAGQRYIAALPDQYSFFEVAQIIKRM
jgi:hypothetical protein